MSTELATRPLVSHQLATTLGMEPTTMLDTLKAQCFKGNPANVTDAQLAAFVSIAVEMKVNPLLPGMLYAFPIQGGGIVPMMGPDGVYKKLSEHPDVDGWETSVFPEDVSLPPTHATTKIWRKGRERPLQYTALLSEWKVGSNPNWASRTRHMLGLRSLKQCARQVIHGVPYDEDERVIMGEINVTPGADSQKSETTTERPAPPPRKPKGANAVKEAPPIEVQTTVVQPSAPTPPSTTTATPATPPPAAEEKKPEPPAPAAATPRTALNDKEKIAVTVRVDKLYAMMITVAGKPTPSVQAKVSGAVFTGDVYHFDGAAAGADGELSARDPWQEGATVEAVIFGRLNAKSGKVMTVVESVKEVPSASPAVEVE